MKKYIFFSELESIVAITFSIFRKKKLDQWNRKAIWSRRKQKGNSYKIIPGIVFFAKKV